ncbi:hypothetical protein O9X98_10260 [Agrobacterium salinitolerans]|nr:hypothetical protein [Agrobacterium salinitolerans]
MNEADYIDPYQQEFEEFIAESVDKIQNGETTIEDAAREFAGRYELPIGFVASNLSSALEQSQPQQAPSGMRP